MSNSSDLLHELILHAAQKTPHASALRYQHEDLSYAALALAVQSAGQLFLAQGIQRGERVAVYLEKRPETVAALYGASYCGAVFVPVNPLLKADQVGHILRDCNVRLLVTSKDRLDALRDVLATCPDLRQVLLVGLGGESLLGNIAIIPWQTSFTGARVPYRSIDSDIAAILYTSGSTGKPKGVVLSQRNMMAGAHSVAQYLENNADDTILSVLPLSFDYGLSQLSTAFLTGACAVLMNYLLPRDIVKAVERYAITGLAAVPPLWIQLSQLDWPEGATQRLRYITNSGGAMPLATIDALRRALPKTKIYLMYGLTEAFRSTYLDPCELERRPDSMGKAIPNAEILIVREDGTPCAANEPGELVHRGALVALGYWNDPEKTAQRFKPVPNQEAGLPFPEMAVWSGDTVRRDEEGFLYFMGRRDDMIKTSGYRVSPSEVEEVAYRHPSVAEAVALGVPHSVLGQAIVLVVVSKSGESLDMEALVGICKQHLPAFMVPQRVAFWQGSLPRNANGKIDRKRLTETFSETATEPSA